MSECLTKCYSSAFNRYLVINVVFKHRKRPGNKSDEELVAKFKMLLHFRGPGNATEKEYQELNDVGDLECFYDLLPRFYALRLWKQITRISIICWSV